MARLLRARDDVSPSAPTACYALLRRYWAELKHTGEMGRRAKITATKCGTYIIQLKGILWSQVRRPTGVVLNELHIDFSDVAPFVNELSTFALTHLSLRVKSALQRVASGRYAVTRTAGVVCPWGMPQTT
jgi:hypothetical protein